jgi:hypothetical protein
VEKWEWISSLNLSNKPRNLALFSNWLGVGQVIEHLPRKHKALSSKIQDCQKVVFFYRWEDKGSGF